MKKILTTTFALALCLSATSALADGSARSQRAISWDEFRARCEHPEQFDVQRAPQNILVQCTDVQTEFVGSAPGVVPLSSARRVTTSVISDKFRVGGQDAMSIPVVTKNGSCLRFKEVEKSLTVERPLSCDDVLSMKGSLDEFCVSTLDAAKGSNPKLVNVHDTGRTVDTCAGLAAGNAAVF